MKRAVPIGAFVVIVIAVVVVFAFSSYIFPQPPKAAHVYSEKQMWITTGILYAPPYGGTAFYELVTSVRSVTNSPIASVNATLEIPTNLVIVTTFVEGLTPISPTIPLGYNMTANAESTELTPPPGGFHLGQTFPETVAVTFRNGTSVQFDLSAQVFQPPT